MVIQNIGKSFLKKHFQKVLVLTLLNSIFPNLKIEVNCSLSPRFHYEALCLAKCKPVAILVGAKIEMRFIRVRGELVKDIDKIDLEKHI